MMKDVLRLRETTQHQLSEHYVGIGNILRRELPDSNGVLARRLSAELAIYNDSTKEDRDEIVMVGTIVSIGADRYCVVDLEEDPNSRGWVSLRKLAP